MKPIQVTQGKGSGQKVSINPEHIAAVLQLDQSDHYRRTSEAQCMIILAGGHPCVPIYANQTYEEVMELWLGMLAVGR